MQPLQRRTATLARLGVLACAAVGLWLGASKGYSTVSDASGEVVSEGEHVASAKAIAAPPAPTFDEAAIRRIAKEEAQSLVARSQVASAAQTRKKAAASAGAEYTTPSDAGIVYARPPKADGDGAGSGTAPPPGQLPQF